MAVLRPESTGANNPCISAVPATEASEEVRLREDLPFAQTSPRGRRDGDRQILEAELGGDLRDACVSLARRAGDAFREACASNDPDEADANYASAIGILEDLWEYAYLRDRPFRDLLALLEASLKRAELSQFSEPQRDVIRQAFCDLSRWMLDESAVEGHIERFADHDVDITAPIRCNLGQRVRVTFEEIKE